MFAPLKNILLSLLLVSSVTHIGAQSEVEPPKEPTKETSKSHISLIAIGDPPPITLTVGSDKLSTYDIPPKSERPPTSLYFKDSKKKLKQFSLSLNRPSRPIPRPKASQLQLFEDKGDIDNETKSPYLKINLPKSDSDLSVFLVRNKKSKSWERRPQVFPYSNSIESFPASSMRIINFSDMPIFLKIGESKFKLNPKKMRIVNLPSKSQGTVEYMIGFKTRKGKLKLIVHTGMSYYRNSRLNLIMYASDSKRQKKPINYTTFITPS